MCSNTLVGHGYPSFDFRKMFVLLHQYAA